MSQVILVGTDGSSGSERALQYAMDRARLTGETVMVAYVIEWSPYSFNTLEENEQRHARREQELESADREIIQPMLKVAKAAGIPVQGKVTHGHPAQALAQMAKDLDAAVLVIGRRGQSRLKSLLFGSVSSSLVQMADRPVTVVP